MLSEWRPNIQFWKWQLESNWYVIANFLWADLRQEAFNHLVGHQLFHLPCVLRIYRVSDVDATVDFQIAPYMIAALHSDAQLLKGFTPPLPAVAWFVSGRLDKAASAPCFCICCQNWLSARPWRTEDSVFILSRFWLSGCRIFTATGSVLRCLPAMRSWQGNKYTSSSGVFR